MDAHAEMKASWRGTQTTLKKALVPVDSIPWTLHQALPNLEKLCLVGGLDISFYPASSQPPPSFCPAPPGNQHQCCNHEADLAEIQGGLAVAMDSAEELPAYTTDGDVAERGVAALVVMSYPELRVAYQDFEPLDLDVPYLPGFLAFREVPAYCRLLERAARTSFAPQVLLVDGCGMLHPEGFGAACHLGVVSGMPTVGVAKNLLCVEGLDKAGVMLALSKPPVVCTGADQGPAGLGSSPRPVSLDMDHGPAGRSVPLIGSSGSTLGVALRPGAAKNPIYISVGHRIGIETALELVWSCCRHRIPEPTRQADILSREYIRVQSEGR